ncbi:MAG: DEAD/DEAH box helicase [Planctomycetota bacterium]|nr:DEAD/DEAH box helicase [Planctomycetota bacterium]MDA1106431.1 DEAD/DEAH box helicase [Planctomycetota bacterium]
MAVDAERLSRTLASLGFQATRPRASTAQLTLPGRITSPSGAVPIPSARLASALSMPEPVDEELVPCAVTVPSLALGGADALRFLQSAAEWRQLEHDGVWDDYARRAGAAGVALGHDMAWWTALGELALDLLAEQRFLPTLLQRTPQCFEARWRPWLADPDTAERLSLLTSAMPAAARAAADAPREPSEAWHLADTALESMLDGFVRESLTREQFIDSLSDRDPGSDAHVAWLSGLLDGVVEVRQPHALESSLLRQARGWLSRLEEPTDISGLRLQFVVDDPDDSHAPWQIRFQLLDRGGHLVAEATTIWGADSRRSKRSAQHEEMGEALLAELARAAHVWPALEGALEEAHPTALELDTKAAHAFLTDTYPLLAEAGFSVIVPDWWGAEANRVGTRLVLAPLGEGVVAGASPLGLQSLVEYQWQLSVGNTSVSVEEFESLVRQRVPLVRLGGRWVEIRAEDLQGAISFLRQHPGGTMSLLQALRLAGGIETSGLGIPVTGFDATGWINDLFGANATAEKLRTLPQPSAFQGTLRPYQRVGLSWLAFLNDHDIGAVLADDMGLGKTIQLIALLQHERETARNALPPRTTPGPTLLVAPLSVLGNWRRELNRFAPELRVHTQHGLDRPTGEQFRVAAESCDVVLTTYAIAVRDRDLMGTRAWERVVLDEAQHIKNPPTKQTAAIRSLRARHRVALTGTPVENRLAELWSIMEFCCPGYLGARQSFQRGFAIPIERHRDLQRSERLRAIVRPFILRRLKTDPKVIDDLPELMETKEFVGLTTEQAALYQGVVREMLTRVDATDGIQRRGLILSSLVKLKQICNHPAHYLASDALEDNSEEGAAADTTDRVVGTGDRVKQSVTPSAATLNAIGRSDKMRRLVELLEEVIANGHRALVFTQYRQLGNLLVPVLAKHLDIDPLFLHGGTPQQRRDQLVERFQSGDPRCPVFVLSLKAGGTGLNLTSANHVFHYDRWWNPAVENQATDRAFRIGQTRAVHVHKFVVRGTLEERIDEMIEQKSAMANSIISAGDAWLTELDSQQLRDLLFLRTQDDPSGALGTETEDDE